MIESIFNMNKIKYIDLEEMFNNNENRLVLSGDKINLFIDIDDLIISKLLKDEIRAIITNSLRGHDKSLIMISAEIINIAAHYRNFFWTRYKKKTSIILYTTDPDKPELSKFGELRNDNISNLYNETNIIINSNLKLLSTIAVYLPQIYYVPCFKQPIRIINHIKSNCSSGVNIIYSNNHIYDSLIDDNTYILRYTFGHKPKILSNDNVITKKMSEYKYKPDNILDSSFLKLFTAINPKTTNLSKVKNISFIKAYKKIDNAISQNIITNKMNINIINLLFSDDVLYNYNKLYKPLNRLDVHKLKKEYLINRNNSEALMELNRIYYYNNNIQLLELLY